MVFYIRVFVLLVLLFVAAPFSLGVRPAIAAVQAIAAVVNDDAISVRDLGKRMRLIMVSSGLQDTKDVRAKLFPQILDGLINEQIMLQEARKLDITVEQAEIEAGFAKIAEQNGVSADAFKDMMRKSNIDITTMHAQIEAQIAWSKVVQQRLQPRVVISDRDVEDTLSRIRSKIGTTEYLAAEIFLPIYGDQEEEQVQRLAERLVREIRSGKARFFNLAQQFSKSAGSMNGGDMGWVQETYMSEEILDGLRSVQKNQVTDPIKTLNGYHILFLRDSRVLTADTLPSRDQVYYSLGNERLDRLQRRHLMDLKAASFIDIRV